MAKITNHRSTKPNLYTNHRFTKPHLYTNHRFNDTFHRTATITKSPLRIQTPVYQDRRAPWRQTRFLSACRTRRRTPHGHPPQTQRIACAVVPYPARNAAAHAKRPPILHYAYLVGDLVRLNLSARPAHHRAAPFAESARRRPPSQRQGPIPNERIPLNVALKSH